MRTHTCVYITACFLTAGNNKAHLAALSALGAQMAPGDLVIQEFLGTQCLLLLPSEGQGDQEDLHYLINTVLLEVTEYNVISGWIWY